MRSMLLATVFVALTASGAAAETNTGTGDASGGAASDQAFMKTAAAGGIAEVESAKLALQKASDKDVKEFAQHMIDDHTQANKELEQIAKTKNAALPKEPDAKHKAVMQELEGKSGKDFDKAYMKAQVKDHQEMISLFQQQASSGKDPELKSFATKTLPALEKHLDHAKKVDGGI
ncbi:MAG TPA: DUF4142 domain-containing protein [Candidatus Binatia bacterium]|nr:DUF4142 domain-containing protein [Candidatus Binatia bacterium]